MTTATQAAHTINPTDGANPMTTTSAATFLADLRAGTLPRRTASVDIYLDPALVAEHDELVEKYNQMTVAADTTGAGQAAHDDLNERIEQLYADVEASKLTFTFRTYEAGDQQAVASALAKIPEADRVADDGAILGVERFLIEPKLDAAQVRDLIPVIGWQQWNSLCATYNNHVFGTVTPPKQRQQRLDADVAVPVEAVTA